MVRARGVFSKKLTLMAGLLALSMGLVLGGVSSRTVSADSINSTDFVTTWEVTAGDTEITIPTTSTHTYNYSVDWDNDGVPDQTGITGDVTHDFGAPGTYTIRISGLFPSINMRSTADQAAEDNAAKLSSIDQWGDNQWGNMHAAFMYAKNMTNNATDMPDLSRTLIASLMFAEAASFDGDLSGWDVSSITNMNSMFKDATSFNGDVSTWDVSNVNNIAAMFSGATSFNQDISSWDLSSAINAFSLFEHATSFNQDLSAWGAKTGNITNFGGMFMYATSFNGDVSTWDVSGADSFNGMFYRASSFNQDVSGWNVSSAESMSSMFYGASSFNQNLSSWDFSGIDPNANSGSGGLREFMDHTGLSTANYDALLAGMAGQSVQAGHTMGAANLTYCDQASHDALTGTPNNWTIQGDVLDANCPVAPIDFSMNIDGQDAEAGVTKTEARPTFSGTNDPGWTVDVYVDGKLVCSAEVDQDGQWSCRASEDLAAGPHTVTATVSYLGDNPVEHGPYQIEVAGAQTTAEDDPAEIGAPNTGFAKLSLLPFGLSLAAGTGLLLGRKKLVSALKK